ncbi:protein-disulfide reductase DsbD [Paraferrimonas haliotis]|uniref:Thiol:disulfide interchange protein DsbD n=1 Tax=Paraferrimonas haliotis TaxID=2013866 RepID=A0AA37WWA9_9GAMM|nr:protein-disulfide reductase DsbD [Paraferrimonas haliotis]GLS83328.1 thiol:disulfide interchange protein DsbD [Paraferrimonas haliotis]
MKKLFSALIAVSLLMVTQVHANTLMASSAFGFLKSEPELMPVNQAFQEDFSQTGAVLTVSFDIADGYYLYRDKLQFSASDADIGEAALPEGKMHHDEYFGEQEVYYNQVSFQIPIQQAGSAAELELTFMGCAEGKLCFPPTKIAIPLLTVDAADGVASIASSDTSGTAANTPPQTQQAGLAAMLENDSFWLTLLVFFGLGIGLALTPCVFPMYPILSGIIVGQGKKLSLGRAFTLSMAYVQGMAVTYSLLGLIVASAGMKYQAALQHPAVLITIAVFFVILSLSMFGLYELQLPSKWQEKLNNISNNQKGGTLMGVVMMGVLSGLVASPCTTAPLSGALIYVAQSGDLLLGFLALYALSMGMGVPLLIIGTTGGKLLPRAGAWMEIIKTIFGFLLIAVAIIMLERIWPGLWMEMLWTVWAISFIGYLMHQNKLTQFNWKQSARSVVLILMLMASFSYGFHHLMAELHPQGASQAQAKHATFERIKSLADLEEALAQAKADGKPVMLDLYADWCVACKEFESKTFVAPNVDERLKQYVLLQADVTNGDDLDNELLEHFGVLGLPTILFFDQQGELQDSLTVTGFMSAQPFADHLDIILEPEQEEK